MCNFKSGLTYRSGGIYCPPDSDDHSAMPHRDVGMDEACKWEYLPPDDWNPCGRRPDWSGWRFVVDEARTPSWWTDAHERAAVREARRVIRSRIVRDGKHEVTGSRLYVVGGQPRITVSGGKVRTFGKSAPRITVSGGEVWTLDKSAPRITVSGGEVRTLDKSAPRITVSGGWVWTLDKSAPRITVSGGGVWTLDNSAPRITVSGGWVRTYDKSAPRITVSGGVVRTYGDSAPRIKPARGYQLLHYRDGAIRCRRTERRWKGV